ncbi:MAG: hypothetical protein JWQ87_5494 [Candidatus Sulfotelmatobacter sp.]|nr:hypothetical protein [Candidatus Sulfotelmatobacter sp.]
MTRSAKPLMVGNRPLILGASFPAQDKIRRTLDAAGVSDYYDSTRFQQEGIAGAQALSRFAKLESNARYVFRESETYIFGNPKAIVALREYAKGQARSSEGK